MLSFRYEPKIIMSSWAVVLFFSRTNHSQWKPCTWFLNTPSPFTCWIPSCVFLSSFRHVSLAVALHQTQSMCYNTFRVCFDGLNKICFDSEWKKKVDGEWKRRKYDEKRTGSVMWSTFDVWLVCSSVSKPFQLFMKLWIIFLLFPFYTFRRLFC